MKSSTVAQNSWIVTPDRFLTGAAVSSVRAAMERVRREGAACGDLRAVRNAAIVEALLGTGLRVSEVCALVVGDAFLEGGNPQILVRRGKGGKRRLVPISMKLA